MGMTVADVVRYLLGYASAFEFPPTSAAYAAEAVVRRGLPMHIALPRVHSVVPASLVASVAVRHSMHFLALALCLATTVPSAHGMPLAIQAIPDNIYAPAQAPPAQPTPAAITPPTEQSTPALTTAATPNRVMPVDAVMLRSGQEVPGDPRLTMEHEGTIYTFAKQGTLDIFRADPTTYAAQQGGACGRMGPLGGLGDARRYAIEDGMLFFFASDSCVRAFREKPTLYMEPQDVLPTGSPEQQAQGLAAIDRWVAWAGGKDAIKSAQRFTQVATRRVEQGGAEWDLTETLEIEGPRSMRRVDLWNKVAGTNADMRRYEIVTTPDSAVLHASAGKSTVLVDSRRLAFDRAMSRQPYAILRARYRPEAGFVAIKTGEGKIGDADCDYVVTWFDGNATYLAIDKSTGRLVQQGFMGRDEQSRNVSLTLDAVSYAGTDALRLPTQWIVSHTGEAEGIKGPLATVTIGWKTPEPTAAQQAPARPRRPAAPPTGERPVPTPPPMPNPASKP